MMINYESLPGVLPRAFLPMIGVQMSQSWLRKMSSESTMYSKGRGDSRTFEGDSQDKDKRATAQIQQYAKIILDPAYNELLRAGAQALRTASPDLCVPGD
jgi:hypothetical protein